MKMSPLPFGKPLLRFTKINISNTVCRDVVLKFSLFCQVVLLADGVLLTVISFVLYKCVLNLQLGFSLNPTTRFFGLEF